MATFLNYFYLLTFWVENSLRIEAEKFLGLPYGLSFKNLSILLFMVGYLLTVVKEKQFVRKNNINFFLLIFTFYVILEIPIKHIANPGYSADILTDIVSLKQFLNPWIIFFMCTFIVTDSDTCKRSVFALLVLLLLTGAAVLLSTYTSLDLGTTKDLSAYQGRHFGFAEANQYASFLVLLLPLPLAAFFMHQNFRIKIVSGAFSIVGLIILFATVSRGGYISYLLSVVTLMALCVRHKVLSINRVLAYTLSLLLIISIAFVLAPAITKEKSEERVIFELSPTETFNPYAEERSYLYKITSGRTEIWAQSIEFFYEKPIVGYGIDACNLILNISTHNDYLMILINYGIIGLIIFVLIYAQILRHVMRSTRETKNHLSLILYVGYMSGFAGYVLSMFSVNVSVPRYIFWFYTAIVYSYSRLESGAEGEKQSTYISVR